MDDSAQPAVQTTVARLPVKYYPAQQFGCDGITSGVTHGAITAVAAAGARAAAAQQADGALPRRFADWAAIAGRTRTAGKAAVAQGVENQTPASDAASVGALASSAALQTTAALGGAASGNSGTSAAAPHCRERFAPQQPQPMPPWPELACGAAGKQLPSGFQRRCDTALLTLTRRLEAAQAEIEACREGEQRAAQEASAAGAQHARQLRELRAQGRAEVEALLERAALQQAARRDRAAVAAAARACLAAWRAAAELGRRRRRGALAAAVRASARRALAAWRAAAARRRGERARLARVARGRARRVLARALGAWQRAAWEDLPTSEAVAITPGAGLAASAAAAQQAAEPERQGRRPGLHPPDGGRPVSSSAGSSRDSRSGHGCVRDGEAQAGGQQSPAASALGAWRAAVLEGVRARHLAHMMRQYRALACVRAWRAAGEAQAGARAEAGRAGERLQQLWRLRAAWEALCEARREGAARHALQEAVRRRLLLAWRAAALRAARAARLLAARRAVGARTRAAAVLGAWRVEASQRRVVGAASLVQHMQVGQRTVNPVGGLVRRMRMAGGCSSCEPLWSSPVLTSH